VLLIDDADDVREVAQMSLEVTGGWHVLAASSGPEGLDLARRSRPDVILLDVMMPGMDGPTTYHELLADPELRSIPVIFLTAKVQSSEHERLLALGARGVLAKPFDPLGLSQQVLDLISR
jgi:CheY-like chemotaxis protein